MGWVDTHAHLDDGRFDPDRDEMVARALAAGLEFIVTIGCDLASSQRAIALAEKYATVWCAVGIQPNYVHEAQADDFDTITKLAEHPRVVAIGETGLDCYWKQAPLELQREHFARHIELARALDKPFVVHTRESDEHVLAMLRDAAARHPLRGIMHSFTGTAQTAAECLALGMHISFAGMVTFKKSEDLRRVAATVPLDRLLVETDSPYLSPEPFRGRRNEPCRVVQTGEVVAAARGVGVAEFAAATTANARKLFGL